jgi:ubiquinone/menaquinone biosynthesis C-methylase UbiE
MNVDWNNYSEVYDVMAESNPAYQDILKHFDRFLIDCGWKTGSSVGDFGAGTGNFSHRAAQRIHGLRVLHIDADEGMNARAASKAGPASWIIHKANLAEVDFPPGSLSGLICVHSIYTLRNPQDFLRRAGAWVRPGGRAFFCDLGRQLNLKDWRRYFLKHLSSEKGWLQALMLFYRARNVLQQNRNIVIQQRRGEYWTHSHSEFVSAVERAGFNVIHSETVYRGYSDLVIAEKSHNNIATL